MRTILVTGGAGFIGANFIHHALNRPLADIRIINLDKLTYAGNLENLAGVDVNFPARYLFLRGDICDRQFVERIFNEHKPDAVVNFAAESHVDRSIVTPNVFVETNVLGTATLLNAARSAWPSDEWERHRFVQVSTDEVYGSLPEHDKSVKFTEDTPLCPHSPYSASKASADLLAQSYFDTYGFPVLITRCSNNYGPYQFPEKLIPLMINNAVNDKPLPVYGDGQNVRDWLYVEDHCEAIYLVVKNGRLGETYNVGGGNQPYNIDLVREICSILDELRPAGAPHANLMTHVQDRPGHDRRYAMDITKIRAELGWTPRHDIESGMRATVQWYLDNAEWVKSVLGQDGYAAWLEKNYTKR